jgi:hypothetical protein
MFELKDLLGPIVAPIRWADLTQYRATGRRDFIRPLREAQLKLYLMPILFGYTMDFLLYLRISITPLPRKMGRSPSKRR